MVQWRTAGLTWYAIAKRLNRDGIETKNQGRAWRGATVSKLLNSRTVTDWLNLREEVDDSFMKLTAISAICKCSAKSNKP